MVKRTRRIGQRRLNLECTRCQQRLLPPNARIPSSTSTHQIWRHQQSFRLATKNELHVHSVRTWPAIGQVCASFISHAASGHLLETRNDGGQPARSRALLSSIFPSSSPTVYCLSTDVPFPAKAPLSSSYGAMTKAERVLFYISVWRMPDYH
jgi:hypothetical protein